MTQLCRVFVYGRSAPIHAAAWRAARSPAGFAEPPEEWLVYLPGGAGRLYRHRPTRTRVVRIEANRARSASMGAVRDGPALLAGAIWCGRCGTRMTVVYPRSRCGKLWPKCECDRLKAGYGGRRCQQLSATCVDRFVAEALPDVMVPVSGYWREWLWTFDRASGFFGVSCCCPRVLNCRVTSLRCCCSRWGWGPYSPIGGYGR